MNRNQLLQQQFLNYIKELSIYNPSKMITSNFVYSNLVRFNINNPGMNVGRYYNNWKKRYQNNPNINVVQTNNTSFLYFKKGRLSGNEIKLYIPLKFDYLEQGANQIFDFISNQKIEHESKIAVKIRNDNLVVRVNSLEDAQKIVNFVSSNLYLMNGLANINPFLPNWNGIGVAMDNKYSYNSIVSEVVCDFFNELKINNSLEKFTVEELNKFIKNKINSIRDLDKRDIYSLISKTTEPNFKIQDFFQHANYKLIDKYDTDRKRITDPSFYLEEAIRITEKYYPNNSKQAILEYLKGNSQLFTRKENVRHGLEKYVSPGDLISIMRSKLKENNVSIPNNDSKLVDEYLKIILEKQKNALFIETFEIIKNAYFNTLNKYNINQARCALNDLILYKNISKFTNDFKDRDKLKTILNVDIKRVILNNINIQNLKANDIEQIIYRFEDSIGLNPKQNRITY